VLPSHFSSFDRRVLTRGKNTKHREGNMAKYGKKAQETVKQVMEEFKKGELKSGKSGHKVTDRKQAVAIGLSEARDKGAKVPEPPKK
jgi:hypothetical protein